MRKLFTFLVLVMIITSCTNDSFESSSDDIIPNLIFDEDQIIEIGIMHNNFVRSIVTNADYSIGIRKALYKSTMLLAPKSLGDFPLETLFTFDELDKSLFEFYTNKETSKIAVKLDESLKSGYRDLNELSLLLAPLEKELNTYENSKEKVSLLVAIEVAKNSAELWLEVEKGGEGFYQTMKNLSGSRNLKGCFSDVVYADVWGATSAMVRVGAVCLSSPVCAVGQAAAPITNGIIASWVAWGAGAGSVGAGLKCLTENDDDDDDND